MFGQELLIIAGQKDLPVKGKKSFYTCYALILNMLSSEKGEAEADLRLVPPFFPNGGRKGNEGNEKNEGNEGNEKNGGGRFCVLFEDLLSGNTLFNKEEFIPIRNMLQRASKGIVFSSATALSMKDRIHGLKGKQGLVVFLEFLLILDVLARSEYRTLSEGTESARLAFMRPQNKRIEKVCSYTALNYADPIRLKDVADVAGMSEDAFGRFFRKNMGISYIAYLNNVRIEVASKMLRETDDTVAGIAYSCGFGTLSNFRRVFRELKGMSPGEIRRCDLGSEIL